jgi:toxin ParE1/3/4
MSSRESKNRESEGPWPLPEVVFSRSSESDLRSIDEYTVRTWGEDQADLYLDQIKLCCQRLASNPRIGRLWNRAQPDLRRMEQGSHVIFYRETKQGIVVSRILHQNMLPLWQPFDETEPG